MKFGWQKVVVAEIFMCQLECQELHVFTKCSEYPSLWLLIGHTLIRDYMSSDRIGMACHTPIRGN